MIATNKPFEIKLKKITKNFTTIKVYFIKDFLKLSIDQIISHSHPKVEVVAGN